MVRKTIELKPREMIAHLGAVTNQLVIIRQIY